MKRAATVALALGAVIGAGLSPAAAQVVIGGAGEPDVQVNWGVLDRLGPVPTLADMLKADIPTTARARAQVAPAGAAETITFRPYAPPKKKVARKAAPAVAKSEAAKTEAAPAVAELAAAAHSAAREVKPAAPVKPATTETATAEPAPAAAPAGPKVSLPETPAPMASAPAPEPVKLAPEVKPETARIAKAVTGPKAEPTPKAAPAAASRPEPAPAPKPEPVVVAKAEPAVASKAEPAVTTGKEPAPLPASTVAAPQVASVPAVPVATAAVTSAGDTLSILFGPDNARLPEASRADLERLAARLEKEESMGLQLLAYAEGDEASASKARRLSLSRALEVRKFLMEQGVRSTRIEVRALGNKSEGGPADRVDAILVAR